MKQNHIAILVAITAFTAIMSLFTFLLRLSTCEIWFEDEPTVAIILKPRLSFKSLCTGADTEGKFHYLAQDENSLIGLRFYRTLVGPLFLVATGGCMLGTLLLIRERQKKTMQKSRK